MLHLASLIVSVAIVATLTGCRETESSTTNSTVPPPPPSERNAQGGVDGGGGNSVRSSADEIKRLFKGHQNFDLKQAVKESLRGLEWVLKTGDQEQQLQSKLAILFKDGAVYQDLEDTPYELSETSNCQDANKKDQEASTVIGARGAKICFSLPKLTELPIQAVPAQLVALAIHEQTHHFGFSEEEALLIQTKVLDFFNNGIRRRIFFDYWNALGSFDSAFDRLQYQLENNASDSRLCVFIGNLQTFSQQISKVVSEAETDVEGNMLNAATEGAFEIPKGKMKSAKDMSTATNNLLSFCEAQSDGHAPEPLAVGDRKGLEKGISRISLILMILKQR